MLFLGTLVNAGLVLAGSLLGLLLGKAIPERFRSAVMAGLALCVLLIAFGGLSGGENVLITIISMVVGVIIGELLRLDDRVNALGDTLQRLVNKNRKSGTVSVAEGFVTCTLLFCIGTMVILGALEAGLGQGHSIYIAKATLDGVSSLIFASSLGVGVCFSAVSVLIVQSVLVLTASFFAPYLQAAQGEMVCVGSLLLVAISLNMLGVTKIKVVNYSPAIFIPIILCKFM